LRGKVNLEGEPDERHARHARVGLQVAVAIAARGGEGIGRLIRIGSVIYAHGRAQAGVSGRSVQRRQAEGAALAVALVAVYVVMAALASNGASDGVVYGVYVVTATLLVLGTFGAARSAVREDWHELGLSIAVVLVAAGSPFAGPRGVWLSNGVGLSVVLLGNAAAQAWLLRARGSGA
jgi:hypothetical protein